MKRFALTAAGVASAAIAGSSAADVTIAFDTGMITGGNLVGYTSAASGTLTGITINVNFYGQASTSVWASDLLIAVTDGSSNGVSAGGYNLGFGLTDLGGFSWSYPLGNYSSYKAANLAINGTVNFYAANGWGTSPGGAWSGTVTLHGLNAVPAPGALALLGVAGLAARRRR